MDMGIEPPTKRAFAFIDGQNLFKAAKEAFGYTFPNYSIPALPLKVCRDYGWELKKVKFYTGVPDRFDSPHWNYFWAAKLLHMSRQGVEVFTRSLRYRNKFARLNDGTTHSFTVAEEKGIDVRLALDVIRLGLRNEYDVAIIFSQDQDLSEVADEIRQIAREQKRWIKIASAFPDSPSMQNRRGINKTDWIRIDRRSYESCVDVVNHLKGFVPPVSRPRDP